MGDMAVWGGLAPLGQAAAIILALFTFVSIVLGVILAAALMFLLAWIREKAELIKRLRPTVNHVNSELALYRAGESSADDNKLIKAVAQVPRITETISSQSSLVEQKIEMGSGRVADVVIELHARAEMVKGIARAFFLPGLTKSRLNGSAEPITLLNDPPVAPADEPQHELPPMEQVIASRQKSR